MSSEYEQMCIGQDLLDAAKGLPPGVEAVEQAGKDTPPPYAATLPAYGDAGHARYQEEALVEEGESARALEAYLDGARMQLEQARSDFDRLKVRNVAAALEAAAAILKRKEIQVEASILVAEAEREIARSNPPKQGGRPKAGKIQDSESHISPDTIRDVRKAHSQIEDDEFRDVAKQARESGQPVTRKALKDLAKAKRKTEKAAKREEAQAKALAEDPGPDGKVYGCACIELDAYVGEGTLDAIFTDPPYAREYLPAWDELALFARHALKPGGLLLAASGQMFLPEVLGRLAVNGMEYRWTVALVWRKPRAPYHAAKVSSGWKPMVVFRRAGAGPDGYSEDAFRAEAYRPAAQAGHKWGQDEALMLAVAEEWLESGWLVADPFCGAGSLMVAAARRGCRVVGCDTEPKHVAQARQALAKVVG